MVLFAEMLDRSSRTVEDRLVRHTEQILNIKKDVSDLKIQLAQGKVYLKIMFAFNVILLGYLG